MYWHTVDGRRLLVDEMSVEHLRNVLKLLIREKRILPPHNIVITDTCDLGEPINDDPEPETYQEYLSRIGD